MAEFKDPAGVEKRARRKAAISLLLSLFGKHVPIEEIQRPDVQAALKNLRRAITE